MTDFSPDTLRIATRKSPLALWQAEYIRDELMRLHPGIRVELLAMSTRGDKVLDSPLAKIGGKGLFVKELENALLDGSADIAVHSTKDVPMELPAGLTLGVICQREDPLDALVLPADTTGTHRAVDVSSLPQGAVVGTSSLRRQCQLASHRSDLRYVALRGNVNTRLSKLDAGEFDAIILAAAGLLRLGFDQRISGRIDPDILLPAVGQGALSIELRSDDAATLALLQPLHDSETATCVYAERAMNRRLEGGCQVPIAGFAQIQDRQLLLEGRVGAVDGSRILVGRQAMSIDIENAKTGNDDSARAGAESLGIEVAEQLLAQGAQALLDAAYAQP